MKLRYILCSLTLCLSLTLWGNTPKYIFYFIGDGMGLGPVQAAQNYLNDIMGDKDGLNMLQMPHATFAHTRSANRPVTDSAAAGTALATGHKTNNSMLGVTPDSTAVSSIATQLHNDGWGVGLVTTVAPDDATPAAFYAHVPKRKMFTQIGHDFIASDFEFLAGSTLRGAKNDKGNSTGLLETIAKNGISLTYSPDSVDSRANRRWILLNRNNLNSDNVGFTIDSLPHNTLQQMTTAAIDHLMAVSPERFFLMVEGGNIDHALHANDPASAIIDIINFDKTLALALEFMAAHPDETLIVVTADHDTGGLTTGCRATGYHCYPERLTHQKMSFDRLNDTFNAMIRSRRDYKWEDIKQFLKENMGLFDHVKVSAKEEKKLQKEFKKIAKNRSHDKKTLYLSINGFIDKVIDLYNDKAGYGFTTSGHSGNPVPLFATGANSHLFSKAVDNTQIPKLIIKAATEEAE